MNFQIFTQSISNIATISSNNASIISDLQNLKYKKNKPKAMTIEFNTGKTDIVLVKRPEWYVSHTIYMGYIIFKVHNEGNFISTKAIENPVLCRKALEKHNPAKDYKDIAIKLPHGDWSDTGNPFELSEEQARQIMKFCGPPWGAYRDWESDRNWFGSARISFNSLLNHLKVYRVNPCGDKSSILKTDGFENANNWVERANKWSEAEAGTGNWILLTAVKA